MTLGPGAVARQWPGSRPAASMMQVTVTVEPSWTGLIALIKLELELELPSCFGTADNARNHLAVTVGTLA